MTASLFKFYKCYITVFTDIPSPETSHLKLAENSNEVSSEKSSSNLSQCHVLWYFASYALKLM